MSEEKGNVVAGRKSQRLGLPQRDETPPIILDAFQRSASRPDSVDVLRSVRLFRKNLGDVPKNIAAAGCVFDWQVQMSAYFISYQNGKSAVSVKQALKALFQRPAHNSIPLESGSK